MSNPRAWQQPSSNFWTQLKWRVRTIEYPITLWLMIGLTALWVLTLIVPVLWQWLVFLPAAMMPSIVFEPWRFVTGLLVHSPVSILHILFNMYGLWLFGSQLEPLLGRRRFIWLLSLSGAAGMTAMLWFGDLLAVTFGASAPVFGLFTAMFVLVRAMGQRAIFMLVMIVANVALAFMGYGFTWPLTLGSMAVGALVGWIYTRNRYGSAGSAAQQKELLLVAGALLALVVLKVIIS